MRKIEQHAMHMRLRRKDHGEQFAMPAAHVDDARGRCEIALAHDGTGDGLGFGQRSRVGFVLEGAIAVKLEFGEDVIGRG